MEDAEMLRMSLLEHLQELRARILKGLAGFGVIFTLCMLFSNELFQVVLSPGQAALRQTRIPGAEFIAIDVMEQFSIIWVWTPLVASLFLSAPWVLWQVWAFIAPGLYQRERRWAMPFVASTAGLFITGGIFAYFVLFPYAMAFLFGLGGPGGVTPKISIDNYFAKFVDVLLGAGIAFEIPVLIFLLVAMRIASPAFLLHHSRYAIVAIVIIASVVTPTQDVVNLMMVTVPMCLLFFLGVFASYLLVLKREKRRFPWKAFLTWLAAVGFVAALCTYIAAVQFHKHPIGHWPFLTQ
jgi:sec-independent protein translocase protein TatC